MAASHDVECDDVMAFHRRHVNCFPVKRAVIHGIIILLLLSTIRSVN